MRHSGLLLVAGAVFLAVTGFHLSGMPYIPDASISDAVISHWPAAYYTRDTIYDGEYPLWRPTILAGHPFAANPLNKTAYPLQWLVLLVPPTGHLNLMILLHMALAAWGMWAWARRVGLRDEAAVFSALAYALAPRWIAHLGAGHLDVIYAAAWLPWLLMLLHEQRGNRVLWILKLALVSSMLLLADVRIAFFGFLLGSVYFLSQAAVMRRFRWVGDALLAVPVFLILTAALLVPLLSWQPYLSRASITADEAGVFSVNGLQMAGLLLPSYGGSQETLVYLGMTVVVLGLIGLVGQGRRGLAWWGILALAVVWSLGANTPLWLALVNTFPFLSWFRVPGRAWVMAVPVMALLAGYGVQMLMAAAPRWRAEDDPPPKHFFWLRLMAAGTGGLMTVCGLTMLTTGLLDFSPVAAVVLLVVGVGMGAVLLLVLLQRARAQVVAWSLFALLAGELIVFGVHWLEWRPVEDWLAPHVPLASRLNDLSPARLYSPSYALPQHVAELANLELFYGVDPFQLTGIVRAIEAGSNVPIEGYSIALPPLNAPSVDLIAYANMGTLPDLTVLAQWDVSHIITAYWLELEDLSYVDTVDGVNIFRNEVYYSGSAPPLADVDMALLPTVEDIARLHRLTIISVWVSAMGFVLVLGAVALLSVREANKQPDEAA